ncbi:MAG: discoidin domain-containing protein [Pseudomonadales bacterium]
MTIAPLVPETWDYFTLADVPYHGHLVSVQWDRNGTHYGRSKGLAVYVDGQRAALQDHLGKVTIDLPAVQARELEERRLFNFAANNDGGFYPQISASFTSVGNPPTVMQDGNYWYHVTPPNRWTNRGSVNESDWIAIDFGVPREIHQLALYVLEDDELIQTPEAYTVEFWRDGQWQAAEPTRGDYPELQGRRANRIFCTPTLTSKVRVNLRSKPGSAFGLTEIEAWGEAGGVPLDAPRRPPSLATNNRGEGFPKVTASHTSRFDRIEQANDGVISYRPQPHNRWTAYESKESSDWLEVEFENEMRFGRIELHFYDDRGGVQPPEDYWVEIFRDGKWTVVEGAI